MIFNYNLHTIRVDFNCTSVQDLLMESCLSQRCLNLFDLEDWQLPIEGLAIFKIEKIQASLR